MKSGNEEYDQLQADLFAAKLCGDERRIQLAQEKVSQFAEAQLQKHQAAYMKSFRERLRNA